MRLKDSFEDFLTDRVNLDPTRVGRVKTAHNTIRDKIAALDDIKPRFVGTYLQGSYALRTAVRPVHDDHEYDVDVVLAMDLHDAQGNLYGGDAVLDWLYGLVNGIALYEGKVERRERCLRVRYASDGQRFHLDVLPAHQPVIADAPILIPPDWAATNPRGYIRWLDGVVRDRCERARHLARLLKFWRNLQYPDGAFAPNSMVLTTLVGLFAPTDAAYRSLDEALVLTMRGINDWLQGLGPFEEVVVKNPSLKGENLARSWSWVRSIHVPRPVRRGDASGRGRPRLRRRGGDDRALERRRAVRRPLPEDAPRPRQAGEGGRGGDGGRRPLRQLQRYRRRLRHPRPRQPRVLRPARLKGEGPAPNAVPRLHRFPPPRRLDPGVQLAALRARFPSFDCRRVTPGQYVFEGDLRPTPASPRYRVRVCYGVGREPSAFVVAPALAEGAPHRWDDGSLCLYHPALFDWHDGLLVADHVVPWVATWLYFYEVWFDLGVWLGPEAPH